MDAPATAVGDSADLLHVQVHHVAGPACIDLPWLAVVFSAGVNEPPPAETESLQVRCDGAAGDRDCELVECVGGSMGRPFVFAPPGVDLRENPDWRRVRTPRWRRRAVVKPGNTVASPPVDRR